MGYFLTNSISHGHPSSLVELRRARTRTPPFQPVPSKTHTPGLPAQDRGLRFYNPQLGRWISRDPLGELGGRNLFLVVQNNLVNSVDPIGQIEWPDFSELASAFNQMKSAIENAGSCFKTVMDIYFGMASGKFGSNDKYSHCFASCQISKDCSIRTAVAFGAMKEWRDLTMGWTEDALAPVLPKSWEAWLHDHIQGGTPYESLLDFLANISGYLCRNDTTGCEKCCRCNYGSP